MTAQQILIALKGRYRQPGWATFTELASGMAGTRIDFYALHTQPGSVGFVTVACEVKVSRADFVHELERPEKRRLAEDTAGETWFVVPQGLVRPDEVPEGWGLLECREADLKLFRKKLPTQRRCDELPLWFVASLARRSSEGQPSSEQRIMARLDGEELCGDALLERVRQLYQAECQKAELRGRKEAGYQEQRADELKALRALRHAVEEQLGDHAASPEGLAAALAGHVSPNAGTLWQAQHISSQLRNTAKTLDELLGVAGPDGEE